MTKCRLCNYPQRSQIEAKVYTKQMTQQEAADLLGCGRSSIQRHMSLHLPGTIQTAIEIRRKPADELTDEEVLAGLDVPRILVRQHYDLMDLFKECLSKGLIRDAIRCLELELRQTEFSAKLTGAYVTPTTQLNQVNLLMNPQFMSIKSAVIEALKEYPEALPEVSKKIQEVMEAEYVDATQRQ
jgi:hypothetical protein